MTILLARNNARESADAMIIPLRVFFAKCSSGDVHSFNKKNTIGM